LPLFHREIEERILFCYGFGRRAIRTGSNMTSMRAQTRRTENRRTGGRAEQVVHRVLRATAEELGRVGYGALRVEDVAAAAGVNKTTVYRRWPTKPALVTAAVQAVARKGSAIDTGSLRGDLRRSLLDFVAECTHPFGRGILGIVLTGRRIPEIESVVRRVADERHLRRVVMVERGIARGELPKGADPEVIVDLVTSPVFHHMLTLGEVVGPEYVDRVLDIVLAGVVNAASTSRRKR
jgi:AcrR family transcriptional regulator